MIKFRLLFLLALSVCFNAAYSQLIVAVPSFPSETDAVEIFFDASLGNAGLAGYTGDVYAHTGVLTDSSTAPSNWRHVKTNWGQNTPATKLERISTNLYKLTISPSVRSYYNVPSNEQILKMAFVFRSGVQVGGKWLEGKTETGGDIFYDVYPDGLFTRFVIPTEKAVLTEPGSEIPVSAVSNEADSMFIYLNDVLQKSVAGNEIADTIIAESSGKHYVRIEARNDLETVSESFYFFVRQAVSVQPLPTGVTDGINYIDENTVILSLYAPEKQHVFVLGDFNNWEYDELGYMNKTPDGKRYWIQLNNLDAGREYIYQYLVDGNIRIGDPYAEKVSDPWNDKYITEATYPGMLDYPSEKTTGVATVLQTAQSVYQWEVTNFEAPANSDLIIYELLVRDFIKNHDFATLIDTLSYLKNMGINAIGLMPFNEFEGNSSWGYNPNYYFAPDKYYGPADDLKRFIDECHKNGIAVIMDMVLNHSFGTSPMVMLYWDAANNRPAANNPWFNQEPKHEYNVGFDFNHESPDTKAFVNRVVKFWIENYNIDGYRFDLSKGFTQKNSIGNVNLWGQYDASRIAIWKSIADTIWSVRENAYVILEHFADNNEEKELANYGMMIWGNISGDFASAAKGASSNFSWASYKTRGWNQPHLISYMESHDEERIMYKVLKEGIMTNPSYRTRDTTIALQRVQLANVFLYSIPGPKMLWQFGELGYDYNIDFNGRTGEKPVRWDYLNDYRRKTLKNIVSSMIKLRSEHQVFKTTDFSMAVSGLQKRINLNDPEMNVVVLGNFDVKTGSIVPNFRQAGKWYEYFTGDSIDVVNTADPIELRAGEFRLYTDKQLIKPETGLSIPELNKPADFAGTPYPNPVTYNIYVPLSLKTGTYLSAALLDLTGRELSKLWTGHINKGDHTLNLHPEQRFFGKKAMYLLKIETESGSQTFKITLN